eukprot:Hpha_TRINITY_DN29912_c0_g1::TRINITY_DN29912_c0_g1_i1::g.131864::m.131864
MWGGGGIVESGNTHPLTPGGPRQSWTHLQPKPLGGAFPVSPTYGGSSAVERAVAHPHEVAAVAVQAWQRAVSPRRPDNLPKSRQYDVQQLEPTIELSPESEPAPFSPPPARPARQAHGRYLQATSGQQTLSPYHAAYHASSPHSDAHVELLTPIGGRKKRLGDDSRDDASMLFDQLSVSELQGSAGGREALAFVPTPGFVSSPRAARRAAGEGPRGEPRDRVKGVVSPRADRPERGSPFRLGRRPPHREAETVLLSPPPPPPPPPHPARGGGAPPP